MTNNGHRNLTQKQEDFCRLYLELGNGTKAAMQAGYSPKTAEVIASENLLKPRIAERIDAMRQQVLDKSIATAQERRQVLTKLIRQPGFAQVQRNIIAASDQMNRLDKLYDERPLVTVDNRKIEITVVDPETKQLLEEVIEGTE